MYIEYFLICRDSAIDVEKNTVSVFDIIEDMTVETNAMQVTFPVQLIACIRRGENDVGNVEERAKLQFIGPDGKVSFEKEVPAKLKAEHRRTRLRIGTTATFSGSGQYQFKIELSGDPANQKAIRDIAVIYKKV